MGIDREVAGSQILVGDERRFKSMPWSEIKMDFPLWSVACWEDWVTSVKAQPSDVIKH